MASPLGLSRALHSLWDELLCNPRAFEHSKIKLLEWHMLRTWRQENLEFEACLGSLARACLNKAKPSKAKQIKQWEMKQTEIA